MGERSFEPPLGCICTSCRAFVENFAISKLRFIYVVAVVSSTASTTVITWAICSKVQWYLEAEWHLFVLQRAGPVSGACSLMLQVVRMAAMICSINRNLASSQRFGRCFCRGILGCSDWAPPLYRSSFHHEDLALMRRPALSIQPANR